jgi:hypothetical protein
MAPMATLERTSTSITNGALCQAYVVAMLLSGRPALAEAAVSDAIE